MHRTPVPRLSKHTHPGAVLERAVLRGTDDQQRCSGRGSALPAAGRLEVDPAHDCVGRHAVPAVRVYFRRAMSMIDFLAGALTFAYLLAAACFVKFWRSTFDRLFL